MNTQLGFTDTSPRRLAAAAAAAAAAEPLEEREPPALKEPLGGEQARSSGCSPAPLRALGSAPCEWVCYVVCAEAGGAQARAEAAGSRCICW